MGIKIWLTDGTAWEHNNITDLTGSDTGITFKCGSRVYVYYIHNISHLYLVDSSSSGLPIKI